MDREKQRDPTAAPRTFVAVNDAIEQSLAPLRPFTPQISDGIMTALAFHLATHALMRMKFSTGAEPPHPDETMILQTAGLADEVIEAAMKGARLRVLGAEVSDG